MTPDTVSLTAAFLAGTGSFLSPCILPMMPTYAALLAGSDTGKAASWNFVINTVAFLGGFTVIFIAMGATASYFGQFFFEYQPVIRQLGAVFMIAMGLQLLGMFKIPALTKEYRLTGSGTMRGPVSAFLLGMAFTAGWTPCTGPILASILVYAGMTATLVQGAVLLFVYSMGFSLPFLAIALLCNRYLSQIRSFYRWLPVIHRIAGVILVLAGIAVYFDWLAKLPGYF